MPEDYQECFTLTDTSLAVNSVSCDIPWKVCHCTLLSITDYFASFVLCWQVKPGFTHTKHVLCC